MRRIAQFAIVGAAALSFAGTEQFGATVGYGLNMSESVCPGGTVMIFVIRKTGFQDIYFRADAHRRLRQIT